MAGNEGSFSSNILTSHDTLGTSVCSAASTTSSRASSPCPPRAESSMFSTPRGKELPHYTKDTFSSAARRREKAERRRERIAERTRLLKLGKSPGSSIATSDTSSMFSASMSSVAPSSDLRSDDGDDDRDHRHDESASIGGPSDFTMNMVEMMNRLEDEPSRDYQQEEGNDRENEEDEDADEEDLQRRQEQQQQRQRQQYQAEVEDGQEGETEGQPADDDGEETEIPDHHNGNTSTELSPPVDASTPARQFSGRFPRHYSLRSIDTANEDLQRQINVLEGDIQYLTEFLAMKDEEIKNRDEVIQAHCDIMQKKEESLKAATESMKSHKTRLAEHLSEDEQKKKDTDAEFAKLKKKLEDFDLIRRELQMKTVELQNMQEAIKQQRSQHDDYLRRNGEETRALAKQKEELRQVVNQQEVLINQLTSEIKEVKNSTQSSFLELQDLEEELQKSNAECNALDKKNDRLTDEYEAKISDLKAQMKAARAESTKRAEALEALAAEFGVSTSKKTFAEILESVHESLHRQAAMKANDQASARLAELEEQLSALRYESDESYKEKRELEETINTLRGELAASASSLEAREASLKFSQDELKQSKALVQTLQERCDRLNSQITALTRSRDEAQAELLNTHRALTDASNTITDFQKKVKTETEQSSGAATLVSSNLVSEIGSLRKTHERQISNIKKTHADFLVSLNRSHSETVRTLETRLKASESRESSMEDQLAQLTTKVLTHDQDMAKLMARNSKLESIIVAKDDTTKEIDQKFAKVLRKREEEWARRIELLLHDRDLLINDREHILRELKYTMMRGKKVGGDESVLYEDGTAGNSNGTSNNVHANENLRNVLRQKSQRHRSRYLDQEDLERTR
ncbi:hypothetical protein KEM56_007523 [Ascosphaera pollenicola]|nr:hypothetical protein KEM56_007523 [Ascosphaera pollenicola]